MTATYTFDVFASLDGFGSYGEGGDWGGYWGKQGPELLAHRARLYDGDVRMVLGATTFREFVQMLAESDEDSDVRDAWVTKMRNQPAVVVSTTLTEPLDWPNASVDHLQVTVFPVLTGRTGTQPIFRGADDFDLELVGSRTLDDRTQELTYRPTLRSH